MLLQILLVDIEEFSTLFLSIINLELHSEFWIPLRTLVHQTSKIRKKVKHIWQEHNHHLVYQKYLKIKQVLIYSTSIKKKEKKKWVDTSFQLAKPKSFFVYSVQLYNKN